MSLWDSHTSVELLPYLPLTIGYLSFVCDKCSKERTEPTSWYRIPHYEFDLCSECKPTFYEGLVPSQCVKGRDCGCDCKKCMICRDYFDENTYYSDAYESIYICADCYNKRDCIVNVNQSGILTDRDDYIIAKHLTYEGAISLPEITAERNQQFIGLIGSIVRVPDTFNNILVWTLITDLTPGILHTDVVCGFAVNVIDPKHPVASVLSDNHGRVAMNVVYDTYEDYLREKEEFNSINDAFDFDSELCFDDNEENTHNFAEYVRRTRELGFYYG